MAGRGVARLLGTGSILMGQPRRERSDMARQARKGKPARKQRAAAKSDYFTQPGKRGAVVVLRKPIGNRATAKVCGIMPTRVHAKMLVNQLERAESVVKDLFLEATDDGIEALEAVLAACCREVLEKGPKIRLSPENEVADLEPPAEAANSDW